MVVGKHEEFIGRLQKSRPAMFRVAEWLHKNNMSVYIPRIRIMPKNAKLEDYLDDCDIHVECPERGKFKIEVKHISVDFTSHKDWPFPDIIVSNKGSVDRNWGQVRAYITVNKSMTHTVTVNCDTVDGWQLKNIYASNYQKEEVFYVCPLHYGQFRKLSE